MAAPAAASSAPLTELKARVHEHLLGVDEPVSTEALTQALGATTQEILEPLNQLAAENRVTVLRHPTDGKMLFRAVTARVADKLRDLSQEQKQAYELIETAGDAGIWTREIKMQTKIQHQQLTKVLKVLEGKRLVKTIKSVNSKSKKLYMLYDLEPAKEITGGPWYTEQEFDSAFVTALSNYVKKIISENDAQDRTTSVTDVVNKIKTSGICKVQLDQTEIQTLLNTLVYDGEVVEVQHGMHRTNEVVYKLAPPVYTHNFFTTAPCGVCPVFDRCTPGGAISPESCEYMTRWLALPVSEQF